MTRARQILLVVMLLALALRVWGITFGLPAATARPDETQIAGAALGFTSGDLRPPFFEWPMLFAYTTSLGYLAIVAVGKPLGIWPSLAAFADSRRQNIAPFLLMPRALSVALGIAAVWWVYRLCKQAFDESTALVAALFLACAFLHVRDSHFGVTDQPMTALVVCAVLLILRWRERESIGAAIAAGVMSGVATSTKYNGALVAVAFLAAWIERTTQAKAPRDSGIKAAVAAIGSYAAAMLLAFLATSPYVIPEWSRFIADARKVEATLAGGHGMVVGQGYTYYATVILPAAIGWPMFIAAIVGMLVLLATRFRASITVLAFPIVYYSVAGRGYAVFARYILPVVPFLCITAAWGVVWVCTRFTARWSASASTSATAVVALAIVAPTAWNSVLLDRLLARTDNRVVASREIYRIVRAGGTLYQSGAAYGQAPPIMDGHRWPVDGVAFDERAGRFSPVDPDWIVVQRSPLVLYSIVPDSLERILQNDYDCERIFLTSDQPQNTARLYDQQDAFFVPLSGLSGLDRPGPIIELYKRKKANP